MRLASDTAWRRPTWHARADGALELIELGREYPAIGEYAVASGRHIARKSTIMVGDLIQLFA